MRAARYGAQARAPAPAPSTRTTAGRGGPRSGRGRAGPGAARVQSQVGTYDGRGAGQRREDVFDEQRDGGLQPVPAGVEVVEVDDRGVRQLRGQGPRQERLPAPRSGRPAR